MGRREKELGTENVTVEFLTFEQDNAKRIAEYIKGDLEKHLQGLTVQIKQQPFKQKLQLEQTGQYDISMVVWGPDYKDPINYLELFTTDSPNNKMDYSNSDYDDLIKKAKYDIVLDQTKKMESLTRGRANSIGRCGSCSSLSYWFSIYTEGAYKGH